jgi:hypothetical protein
MYRGNFSCHVFILSYIVRCLENMLYVSVVYEFQVKVTYGPVNPYHCQGLFSNFQLVMDPFMDLNC